MHLATVNHQADC